MNTNTNAIFGFNEDGTMKAPFGLTTEGRPRKNAAGRPKNKQTITLTSPVPQVVLNRKGAFWVAQFDSFKGRGAEVAEAMEDLKANVSTSFVAIQSAVNFLGIKTPNVPKPKGTRAPYNFSPDHRSWLSNHAKRLGKTRKPVSQFTPEGQLVATFSSISEISKVMGTRPSQIRVKCKSGEVYKGYVLKFATENATSTEVPGV